MTSNAPVARRAACRRPASTGGLPRAKQRPNEHSTRNGFGFVKVLRSSQHNDNDIAATSFSRTRRCPDAPAKPTPGGVGWGIFDALSCLKVDCAFLSKVPGPRCGFPSQCAAGFPVTRPQGAGRSGKKRALDVFSTCEWTRPMVIGTYSGWWSALMVEVLLFWGCFW